VVNIPLLEPIRLNEVVEFLTTPENLVLSNSLPKLSSPVPFYTWEIIRGSRMVAKPNVPNSEAHIIPRRGRSSQTAALVYTREKKEFEPTTTMWLRQAGTLSDIQRAEEAILAEIQDLNMRVDNMVEYACWQALQGVLTFPGPDVVVSPIDYGFLPSHKPFPGVGWDTATASQIAADIIAWKRLAERDARVPLTDAWCSTVTIQRIFDAWFRAGEGGGMILSDRMIDQYYSTFTLPGFAGLNWHVVEGQYDTDAGDTALFLPDDTLILTNLTYGQPMKIVEGPTADFGAPQGSTGKFVKSWEEPDPSGRQALMEYYFLPIITRPDQIVVVNDVTATS